jgi:hypothetical protein
MGLRSRSIAAFLKRRVAALLVAIAVLLVA